jgi:hypothetical protein
MFSAARKKKIELLYLNTITDNFVFYAWMIRLLKNVRVVVTLHSINNFFDHRPAFSLRRIIRTFGKKQLIKAVDEYNVVALTMVDHLRSKLPGFKKIHALPGAIFEGRISHNKVSDLRKNMQIVVPGIVDQRRRNYDQVFDLIHKLHESGLRATITLLGGFHPEHGLAVLKKIRNGSFDQNFRYYEAQVVDQPEFDRVMDEAHLVFIPSVIYTSILDDIPETYGLSMSSGNLFDIVKHGKPFIAPAALRVDPYLEESRLSYESVPEIVEFLEALTDSPDIYLSLLQKAVRASSHYTIEKVRERNNLLFGKI